jgi:CBS domain-containing protein
MKAKDVMIEPTLVTPSSPIPAAARAMADREVSLLAVVDDVDAPRLRGLITDRDILARCVSAGHRSECLVRDHMTRHSLVVARPDDQLDDVLQRMENAHVHRVPVVETDGRVVGVVVRNQLGGAEHAAE